MLLSKTTRAAALVLAASAPAQQLVVNTRPSPSGQQFLLFSFGRGQAPIQLPGVNGALWLDPSVLIVLPAAAPVQGISSTAIPGASALPATVLGLQTLDVAPGGNGFGAAVRKPLVERGVDQLERSLPALGPSGSSGPFLFGLSQQQIVATAQHYQSGSANLARVLRVMSRPYHFVTAGHLAEDIGLENSARVMHMAWGLMLQRVPRDELRRQLQDRIEVFADMHLEETFPDGVPDVHEYWGEIGGSTPVPISLSTSWPSCSKTKTDEHYPYRLTVSVSAYDMGGIGYGSTRAKLQKKVIFWVSQKADWIEVDGDLCGSPCQTLYDIDTSDNDAEDSVYADDGGYTISVTGSAERSGITLSKSVSCTI